MTVSATTASEIFSCDGATSVFVCPFRALSEAEVQAYLITVATGARVPLTNGVDYTVTNAGTDANCIVTTTTTYSNLYQLKCKRSTARVQETDYRDNDPFPAESHEAGLDRSIMIHQETDEALQRAIIAPDGETLSELPAAASRANGMLAFDSLGNPYIAVPVSGSAADALLQLANKSDQAKGAELVGFLPDGTGAVGRSVFSILRERKLLTNRLTTAEIDDILSGTGSIDISAKFQTALTDAGGKVLLLPDGRIRADNLTVNTSRSTIVGSGGFATRISAPTAANNVFTISTGDYIELVDLMIDSVGVRSGGRYVDIAAPVTRFRLKNFYFDGFYEAIHTLGAAVIDIEHGKLANGIAVNGIGIRVSAGMDVSIRDINMDAAAQTFAGIYVTATGDLTIEDCNIIHAGQALYLNPGAGQVVASVWANNSFFDTSSRGLYVNPNGAGAAVVRCIADECWFGGASGAGVQFVTAGGGTVNGFDFNNCHIFNNGSDGINIGDTGTTNVNVNGGAIAGNVGAGFSVAANVSEWGVRGARIGNTHGLAANGYGIFVSAGASANFIIEGNDLRGNTTAAISDSGTGAGKVIAKNLGWGYGVSVGYNPPNLVDGAGVTTTVTVTGAVLGDLVTASFSQDLQGITLTAWVSAANTVSVRFQNESGGALDLIAGDLRAVIERLT